MHDLTLRDAIRDSVGYDTVVLEQDLEAAGFDLDVTAAEAADGRAWNVLAEHEAYAKAEHYVPGDDVSVRKYGRTGHGPTLAAAVAALEADDE